MVHKRDATSIITATHSCATLDMFERCCTQAACLLNYTYKGNVK